MCKGGVPFVWKYSELPLWFYIHLGVYGGGGGGINLKGENHGRRKIPSLDKTLLVFFFIVKKI